MRESGPVAVFLRREEQVQTHSNQKDIILHTIGAAAHHKPAFLAMHHDDSRYQYGDCYHSRRFDVAVQDEQPGTGHMREFHSPGNGQPERSKAERIEVEPSEIVDATIEHTRYAVHEQDHRKRNSQNERFIYDWQFGHVLRLIIIPEAVECDPPFGVSRSLKGAVPFAVNIQAGLRFS